MGWDGHSDVIVQLLVDIAKRWWNWNSRSHRETQAVCLFGSVVGILSEDDHPGVRKRCEVKGCKYFFVGWVHLVFGPLVLNERHQL